MFRPLADVQWGAQPRGCVVVQVISSLLRRSSLSAYERGLLEQQLSMFDVAVGACERIQSQTIPLAYTRHTSRFLLTYLTLLPFALWPFLHWLCVPAMAGLCFLLVGIENVGIQLEQPLMVLPLRSFAQGCRRAVEAVADTADQAKEVGGRHMQAGGVRDGGTWGNGTGVR